MSEPGDRSTAPTTGRPASAWLFSPTADLLVLGLPVWITWIICFSLPAEILQRNLPLWMWAVVIVGIDVSHVWSTLFRTYLDRGEFQRHRALLVRAPFLAFGVFFLIAGLSSIWFWRVMAYLAVFHFVRQQYGFFALYAARHGSRIRHRLFSDNGIIYLATLYPLTHWHLSADRHFDWFVEGDFLTAPIHGGAESLSLLLPVTNILFWMAILFWCAEEVAGCRASGQSLPYGKILWLFTTAGTWYLGIVHFNSDVAFTLTNVVAHGVPYIALICFYNMRKETPLPEPASRGSVVAKVGSMLGVILLLAFGEEYLWDMFLYQERKPIFESFFSYPLEVLQTPLGQSLALALLSVPQVTHYIVDGFIWKANKNPLVKQVFSLNR